VSLYISARVSYGPHRSIPQEGTAGAVKSCPIHWGSSPSASAHQRRRRRDFASRIVVAGDCHIFSQFSGRWSTLISVSSSALWSLRISLVYRGICASTWGRMNTSIPSAPSPANAVQRPSLAGFAHMSSGAASSRLSKQEGAEGFMETLLNKMTSPLRGLSFGTRVWPAGKEDTEERTDSSADRRDDGQMTCSRSGVSDRTSSPSVVISRFHRRPRYSRSSALFTRCRRC
jgi:hypothetical protein